MARRFQNAELFWQVERRGRLLLVTTGKRRTAGKTVTRELASAADAAKELERLVAEKKRERYIEVKVGDLQPKARDATVAALLEELRELGVIVETRVAPRADIVEAAEKELRMTLPTEYRAFLKCFGQIEIERERRRFFYGLPDAVQKTKEYAAELERWRGAGHPVRFVVLADQGDFSNVASGHVYDDDRKAIVTTSGGDLVDESTDVRAIDYWSFLVEELKAIRDE